MAQTTAKQVNRFAVVYAMFHCYHKVLCKLTWAFVPNQRAIPQTNYFRLQTQLAVNCQLLVFFLVAVFFIKYDNYILQNVFCLLVLLGEKEAFLARN